MSDTAIDPPEGMGPSEFMPFWDGLRQRRLSFPLCRACGQFHWYPMPRCPHCLSTEIVWQPVTGRGEVFTFTVVHHPFDRAFAERIPYVVALVTFADAPGVRLVTNLVNVAPHDVRIGLAVEAVFVGHNRDPGLVLFQPVGGSSNSGTAAG